MNFKLTMNEGIGNLYFGHPFARETYTNSAVLKTIYGEWSADFDGVYSGTPIPVSPLKSSEMPYEDELRVIRGTKVFFIGDYQKVLEMEQDIAVYHDLCRKATIKVNNPDYLEFDSYTERILNDPMKSIEELKSVDVATAKKYMEYAVLYDKDKKYSDRLIIKPYFASCDSGVLMLTEDFVDFNIDLQVSPENGVLNCIVTLSENTSKYIKHYKEI